MRLANAFFAATRSCSRFHLRNCLTSRSSLVILLILSLVQLLQSGAPLRRLKTVAPLHPRLAPALKNLGDAPFDSVQPYLISNFHLQLPFFFGLPATTAILPFTPHIIAYFPLVAQGGILPLVLLVENAPSASSTNVHRRKIFQTSSTKYSRSKTLLKVAQFSTSRPRAPFFLSFINNTNGDII